jgi:hypothetical protein
MRVEAGTECAPRVSVQRAASFRGATVKEIGRGLFAGRLCSEELPRDAATGSAALDFQAVVVGLGTLSQGASTLMPQRIFQLFFTDAATWTPLQAARSSTRCTKPEDLASSPNSLT